MIRSGNYNWRKTPAWLWIIPLGFVALFFFYPLWVILSTSFARTGLDLSSPALRQNISQTVVFTFWQAILSTGLTFLIGFPSAYLFSHYKFPGNQALRILISLPFILPTVVAAAGFNALIGSRGLLNLGLQNLFRLEKPPIVLIGTLGAILLAHVFYNTSIVIRLVGGAWSVLSRHPEQVARTLGANRWQVFLNVTLPLLRPAILSALVLVFLYNFTSFGVVLLLGGVNNATIEVAIYTQAIHLFNLPVAALLTVIQLICTLILTLIHRMLSSKSVPLSPASEREVKASARTWKQKLFVTFMVILLITLVLSPLAALVTRSFIRLEANRGERGGFQPGFTTAYYQALFVNPQQSIFYVPPIAAVVNSLRFALAASIMALLVGGLAAYGLRHQTRITHWLDMVFLLPMGASAVTLGLGLLLAYSRPPLVWATSPWIIPAVHSLAALPFVIRTIQPVLSSIPTHLPESAAVLGASPFKIVQFVDWPLTRRAVLSSLIFAFTISLGEFGATAFLTRPEFPTIPIAIFRYLSQPGGLNYGQALAMAVILLVVCGTGITLIEKMKLPGSSLM